MACRLLCWPSSLTYICGTKRRWVNTFRPRQNGCLFTDDIFKCILLNENVWIPFTISLKFVSIGPINNIPALVQIKTWHRQGNKPLSEPMMLSLLMHIYVTCTPWETTASLYGNEPLYFYIESKAQWHDDPDMGPPWSNCLYSCIANERTVNDNLGFTSSWIHVAVLMSWWCHAMRKILHYWSLHIYITVTLHGESTSKYSCKYILRTWKIWSNISA